MRKLKKHAAPLRQSRDGLEAEDMARVERPGNQERQAVVTRRRSRRGWPRHHIEVSPCNIIVVRDKRQILVEGGQRRKPGLGILEVSRDCDKAVVSWCRN